MDFFFDFAAAFPSIEHDSFKQFFCHLGWPTWLITIVNILYQDNKSTILLAKNGRMSAGKASKHIKNRFYLVTDKIAQGDLTVEHRPTKEMWADVNTKPLQGKLFREMRAQLMGVPIDYDDDQERRRTHPKLLPKVEAEAAASRSDMEVLRKATGIPKEGHDVGSTPQRTKATAKRRSVLDVMKHGPGSRPFWADPGAPRYPDFVRLVKKTEGSSPG